MNRLSEDYQRLLNKQNGNQIHILEIQDIINIAQGRKTAEILYSFYIVREAVKVLI